MQFFILLSIIGLILCKFRIQSPTINNQDYKDQIDVNYSVANFGHVPYGKKMGGLLYLPPLNVSNTAEFTFCDISQVDYNREFFRHRGERWVIVRRGGCPFTRKAINAQKIGAKLIVIVDNRDENPSMIMMADDGNGYQVEIPSILISKADGEQTITYLSRYSNKYLSSNIDFETQQEQKPNVLFGLNIENRESFKLLKDFKEIYDMLKDSINFNIYYEVLRCFSCENNNWTSTIPDCIGGGKYCQFDPDGASHGNGAHVIQEQLRQTCIWRVNSTLWWEYTMYFYRDCNYPNEYESCYKNFTANTQTKEISKCLADSYYEQQGYTQPFNKILDEQFQLRYTTGIVFYPGVSINNVAYRGNVEAEDVKQAICASMITPVPECTLLPNINPYPNVNQESYTWLVVTVIATSVLFILFIVFIYRRNLKKNMEQGIRDQVQEKMNQYAKFYESRSDK